jgi:outer membrane protein, heavy metal efflux system
MKPVFISILTVLNTCFVFGQDSPSPRSTNAPVQLDAVVNEALEMNPELNFYRAEIEAAKGERRTAGVLANPEFTSTVGDKKVNGNAFTGDGIAWSVSVRQPFEWPGRIPLRKAIANRQIRLAELGFEQFKAALKARVRLLGFNVASTQEKAEAAQEVADRFHTLREVLVQRDPAGLTPALELRIIEATELSMQRKASEANLALRAAVIELNQLRGAPLDEFLRVQTPEITFGKIPDTQTLLQMAETNNFEIKLRHVELEQQGFKLSLAKNERYPAVSVGPYYSQERAGDREQQVGIGVSIPVPLWNRNSGKIATENARKEQAATSFNVTRLNIQRQVLERANAYENRTAEMANWRPDSIKQFRESAALADQHYRLGAVPVATYVELQKQYLDAIETLMTTKKDALDAKLQLEQLVGTPLQGQAVNEPAK